MGYTSESGGDSAEPTGGRCRLGARAGRRAPRGLAAAGASPAWEEVGLRPYPPFPEKETPGGALITEGPFTSEPQLSSSDTGQLRRGHQGPE